MKHFTSVEDVSNVHNLIQKSIELKKDPFQTPKLGENKTLGLVFFNSSLRTRMSMTRAAYNLGLKVIVLNVSAESWQLEFEDGGVMDGDKAEHIKEAVPVMCSYCDILAVRSFPGLKDQKEDYQEKVLKAFVEFGSCPIINLESSTLHPLQSLTDMVTIEEFKNVKRPKVVLTWAPHIKALPQAVPNSFLQWANTLDFDLTVTHPKGMELHDSFVGAANIEYDQDKALQDADFIYVKNWSSFRDYGAIKKHPDWELTLEKLKFSNNAKVMHCLPVRRNLVISEGVLESDQSIVIQQAENRLYTAQTVLSEILMSMK
ncbi:N-acetylornithine carbamoyltransferase [Ekhidna sp.]